MKRILTYNGIDLSTFGAHVSGEGAWVKPAPEFERISVPGRSGDVLLYNGRYANVDITYRFGITYDFDENYNGLIAALMGSPGYHKLVDSKHPGVYRMAAVDKGIAPVMTDQQSVGELEVTFNCKPQTYLDSGAEVASTWDSAFWQTNYLQNPTAYEAKPLIKVTTQTHQPGAFMIGMLWRDSGNNLIDQTWLDFKGLTTGTITGQVIYDSATGDVYDSAGKSLNSYARLYNHNTNLYMDACIPGKTRFQAWVQAGDSRSEVSVIEIIPRWWRL